jgi:hypothetical protein
LIARVSLAHTASNPVRLPEAIDDAPLAGTRASEKVDATVKVYPASVSANLTALLTIL